MAIHITRTAAAVTEQVISSGRCRLWAIVPEVVTTGTLTIRNDSAANGNAALIKHLAAIGVPVTGKYFKGAQFETGLTIQQSVATDQCAVVWESAP